MARLAVASDLRARLPVPLRPRSSTRSARAVGLLPLPRSLRPDPRRASAACSETVLAAVAPLRFGLKSGLRAFAPFLPVASLGAAFAGFLAAGLGDLPPFFPPPPPPPPPANLPLASRRYATVVMDSWLQSIECACRPQIALSLSLACGF